MTAADMAESWRDAVLGAVDGREGSRTLSSPAGGNRRPDGDGSPAPGKLGGLEGFEETESEVVNEGIHPGQALGRLGEGRQTLPPVGDVWRCSARGLERPTR